MIFNQTSGTQLAQFLNLCSQFCAAKSWVSAYQIRICRAIFARGAFTNTHGVRCNRFPRHDDDTYTQGLKPYCLRILCTWGVPPNPNQATGHRRLCSRKQQTEWSTRLTSNRKYVAVSCFQSFQSLSTSPQASAIQPRQPAYCCRVWKSALLQSHLRRFWPLRLSLWSSQLG